MYGAFGTFSFNILAVHLYIGQLVNATGCTNIWEVK